MGEQSSLFSLMIVVSLTFIIPIVLHRLRWRLLPVVVAEILAGILLGRSGFGLIQEDQWLTLLSTLGFIYLMFLSGLEIDFDSFKVKGKSAQINPLLVSSLSFLFILLISALLGFTFQWMGFVSDGLFMTLIISTISLSVIVPILKDKGITSTPYGQSILLTAVISDFATMILLAIYVAFQSANPTKLFLLLILFVVVFFAYRFMLRFKAGQVIERITRESVQLGTRGVFTLILFFVVLSEKVGAESILGAFLAGVLVSLLSPKKEFSHQLTSFGFGFLIPIFFFMVGANLELRSLFHNSSALFIIPFVLISFFLSKLLPIFIWKKWFSWKETLSAGLLLPSTLSLVIAATAIGLELGLIDGTLQAALILSAVISTIISPILFQKIAPTHVETVKKRISLIGANSINLSLALQLHQDGFDVTIYTSDETPHRQGRKDPFETEILARLHPDLLSQYPILESDCVVAFTNDEKLNIQLANWVKEEGVENVICRLHSDEDDHRLVEGVEAFSTFTSTRTLLQVLIAYPSLLRFLQSEQPMQEVKIEREDYHNRRIKDLSFLGNALIIRIFRANDIIVPRGNTHVKVGDILLISADKETLQTIQSALK